MNFIFPNVSNALLKSLVLPWLFRQLGVGRWLRERAVHIPQAAVGDASRKAQEIARGLAGGAEPTPEMLWRAQEQVQAALIEGKVTGA